MIPRTVYLGEYIEATAAFFEDGRPIESSDPSIYPFFVVKDINGDMVQGGVGSLNQTDNLYHATFTLPSDAPISGSDEKYIIEWELEGKNGKTYKNTEYFDVVHPSVNAVSLKEQQKLALPFTELTLSLPLPEKPDNISFELYNMENSVMVHQNSLASQQGTFNGYFIYTVTIPANVMQENKIYNGVWKFNLGGEVQNFLQNIQCADLYAMSKISDMRMYLDKVAKEIDLYVGYRDSDLYFHLMNGIDIVNIVTPITEWTLETFKGGMGLPDFILMGGGCYSALRAQYLAEGDSSFDYSGQPVTLSVDRTQFIESELGRWEQWLKEDLKEYKKQLKNRSHGFHLGLTYPNVSGWSGVAGADLRNTGVPLKRTIGVGNF